MVARLALAPCLSIASVQMAMAADLYKSMETYFKKNMPGQGFVPTPYGADLRFQPKTIWIYADGVQKGAAGAGTQKAWIVASSGRAVFDDIRVPVQRDPIDLASWALDKESKWALAASFAGAVRPELSIDAAVDAAISNGIDLDIAVGEAEVEYCYYFDMLSAQDENSDAVSRLLTQVKARYPGTLPQRRTIVAAIRVRNSNITLKNTKAIDINANATLSSLVKALGFGWNSDTKRFEDLAVKNWRYIAYSALYGTDNKLVSEGQDAGAPMKRDSEIPAEMNAPFSRSAGRQSGE